MREASVSHPTLDTVLGEVPAMPPVRDADLYARLIRPVLFMGPAELAHSLARVALKAAPLWRLTAPGADDPRLAVTVGGIRFPNPVGLAPGFDKDCDLLESLAWLGFGFLAPGSIMGQVRAGNPKPRLARLVEREAIMNSMGLPSKGVDHAVDRLRRLRSRPVPILADVQGTTPDEIVSNVNAVQLLADGLEVSLVCPNTRDTEANSGFDAIEALADSLARIRQGPIFVKIPLHIRSGSDEDLRRFLDICLANDINGVVACGARRVRTNRLAMGEGQLGGRPVFQLTIELVRRIRAHVGGRLGVIASGGIFTGRDVVNAIRAGADCVEIYSALIYRGWRAPALINAEVLTELDRMGVPSMAALRLQR
jgi:dihydroorotate dehydrogenase